MAEESRHRSHEPAREPARESVTGRISGIEAVSYTAVILLIAAVAAGWFDPMLPWK